jgi:L-threonylcarbamoyladenylate synthase
MESLKKVHPNVELAPKDNTKVVTSGMDLKHYAPTTKLIIVDNITLFKKNHPELNIGVLTFEHHNNRLIAKEFYYQLNQQDQQNFDVIISNKLKKMGIGKALNDKLQRASYSEGAS